MKLFKTQTQIIAEIHNEFDTAQDRLLCQSEKLLSELNIPTESQIEKQADRLKSVGFVNTPLVEKATSLKKSREESQKKLVETKDQAETIRYYKQTYPFLKFISEDELNRICDKYRLIHAPVGNYIKEVPEKNLRDIERAQALKGEDIMPNMFRLISKYPNEFNVFLRSIGKSSNIFSGGEDVELLHRYSDYWKDCKENPYEINTTTWLYHIWDRTGKHGDCIFSKIETIDKSGLFIAAPASHFNLKGLTKKSKFGFFSLSITEVKDPIVFRYVKGGIQILTMWGLEAEDPALVNPINN